MQLRRSVVLGLLCVLCFVAGAAADKTLTYFTLTLTDINTVCFDRAPSAPNAWTVRAVGSVRASAGSGYAATISGNATAGQKTTIETFITNTVLPALNAQEGL